MSASTIFSGARAIIKLAQAAIGYIVNCSGTTGINYQPLNVLAHLETVEHVPVAYTVEMSASLARVANVTRLAQGTADRFPGTKASIGDGGADSPQVMAPFGDDGLPILTAGELQADIFDRVLGGDALYSIGGVRCSQKAWEMAPGGMVAENCQFVARTSNEFGENTGAFGT